MKTKKIDINYKPLYAHVAINEVGSISSIQTYDAVRVVYDADYTLTPLVLQPTCNIVDRDGVLPDYLVNASITNMKHYEIVDGTKTLIDTGNSGYEITQTGSDKGRIKIKKNSSPLHPVTIEFYAEYLDTRTGQILVFRASHLIKCINATEASPMLTIDSASTVLYDPLSDIDKQVITASLAVGETDVTSQVDRRKFFWYIKRTDGLLTLAGGDDLDIDVVNVEDNVLTVNRKLMGSQQAFVCKATYSADSTPASSPSSGDAAVSTTIVRRIPGYDYDISNLPGRIAPNIVMVYPKAIVTGKDGTGRWVNWTSELFATWYKGNAQIGIGEQPALKASDVTSGILGVDVKDLGGYKILTDGDGNILTSDGKIILTK